MLKNLFPRLFGQFREGGIIHAKFVVVTGGAGSTYVLKTAVGTQNYQSLSLSRNGVGDLTLTLAGAARSIAILDARFVNISGAATATSYLQLQCYAAISEALGQVKVKLIDGTTAGEKFTDTPIAGDEIHFTLYVDR